jgi:membrane dipeptidase
LPALGPTTVTSARATKPSLLPPQTRVQLSRRELLALVAGAGAALLAPGTLSGDDLDPRVADIVAKSMAVDMHNHAPVSSAGDGQANPADEPPVAFSSELKRAGLTAACHTYAIDHVDSSTPGEYYKFHLQALDQEDRLLVQQKMRRAFNLKDIQTAHDTGQPVVIQTCEGAQFLEGHLDRVEEAYRRGLRLMQLVHRVNDLVSPLGDIQTRPANEFGGLTPFGAKVVKECNRLHLMMDLAHAGFPMVKGVLDISTQPILFTHTSIDSPLGRAGKSESMLRRLVTREQARAVADAGGVVGVWLNFDSIGNFGKAVREMVDAVGVDHVGFGTDTYTGLRSPAAGNRRLTNHIWADQQKDQQSGFVYQITDELLRQAFMPAEISKIVGGNFCRVFDQVMGNRS